MQRIVNVTDNSSEMRYRFPYVFQRPKPVSPEGIFVVKRSAEIGEFYVPVKMLIKIDLYEY